MPTTATTRARATIHLLLGVTVATLGRYVVGADDAPGAAVLGLVLMVAGVVLVVKGGRHRVPAWGARLALALGVANAALVAVQTHTAVLAAPLFRDVPSVADSAARPEHAAAIERARTLVRTGMLERHLPGVSVAVGIGATVVWAEGFGWRDVATQTAVTPATRFHIGSAVALVAPAAASLGLPHTGADSADQWSPERTGEPDEDPPLFTIVQHVLFRPLGLAPAQPLPDHRATVYVPRAGDDPVHGRRLMKMRDLACCANGRSFSSTPSDLVRVALATGTGSLHGELAGGRVMSLVGVPERGLAVAVTSNIAHTDTASLARGIAETFATLWR